MGISRANKEIRDKKELVEGLRTCNKCGQDKPIKEEYYHKHKSSRLGFALTCKECVNINNKKKLRLLNPEFALKEAEKKLLDKQGNKRCNRCDKILPKDEFRDYKLSGKIVKRSKCKTCERERAAEYRKTPEGEKKRKEYRKKWYKENKEYSKQRSAEYWKENSERLINQNRKWKKENPEKVEKQWKKYRVENNESIRAWKRNYERERRVNDPIFATAGRIRGRLLKAFKNKGFKKGYKTEEMLGCSFDELLVHLQDQFKDGMNWENKGEWDIDHIIPLNSADSISELYALAHYKNLQPLWNSDNIKKGDHFNPKDKDAYFNWYYSEFPDKKPT